MTTATKGRFGRYGGQYVPETLMPALTELDAVYEKLKNDASFLAEFDEYLCEYAGRPSPLTFARRLSHECGCRVYLKREDLNHTGSHKINNCLGQALVARWMEKPRIIAETGAGQHGVATATVAALFGLKCAVYMGEEDVRRQALNVFRMRLLGAEVIPVTSGTCTLKDAMNEAIRDWMENVADTFYMIGSVAGPHPYPTMVRDFQRVIGVETRAQCLAKEKRLPTKIFACVGGGSNSIGIFHPFLEDKGVELFGAEAAGEGLDTPRHAATLEKGSYGILHGAAEYMLQDEDGQVLPAHSISAGLDYPGVGPEHCLLKDTGRATYLGVTDNEAIDAFCHLSETEGIIPALESAHAVALALRMKDTFKGDDIVVINVSGRGDKDAQEIQAILAARA